MVVHQKLIKKILSRGAAEAFFWVWDLNLYCQAINIQNDECLMSLLSITKRITCFFKYFIYNNYYYYLLYNFVALWAAVGAM